MLAYLLPAWTQQNPLPAERLRWLGAAIVTGLAAVAIGVLLLTGCKPKSQASTNTSRQPIPTDTIRPKLANRADSSSRALDTLRQRNQSTGTNYENAKKTYDSIRVSLP